MNLQTARLWNSCKLIIVKEEEEAQYIVKLQDSDNNDIVDP